MPKHREAPITSEAPAETPNPWGWKVTIHAYGTGVPPSTNIHYACYLVEDVLAADDFVGADVKIVQTKPSQQEGS